MISVTILTKNSAETLLETLQSLTAFSEVLIYDNGSTDSTLAIAGKFSNVRVITGEFTGFGPTHNHASSLAKHDWILSIDSDEVLSEELAREILEVKLDASCVYTLGRHNFFRGKWIRGCSGWHPDVIVRLYNRTTTRFTDARVHERIIDSGLRKLKLKGPLYHTPYRKIGDFLQKMQSYSTLFAEQNHNKKRSSIWKAILHSWTAFLKSYILKRGFLAGAEGFIISSYNAHTTFYKYLKLSEKD